MTSSADAKSSEAAIVADPRGLRRWIADSAHADAFWSSAPAWRPTAARVHSGLELVVWSNAGVFTVAPVPAAVAAHFDGTVTLAELAQDLASVAGVPEEQARDLVATLAVELTSLRAICGAAVAQPIPEAADIPEDGPPLPSTEVELGESSAIDPETGKEIRVVAEINSQGHLIRTEYLPDGRRRISTTIAARFETGSEDSLADAALAGNRSIAELVPPDSCLGTKLRNHHDVPLISFIGSDGRTRSVRCHAPEVAERLRAMAGDALITSGERGPTEAFVVTPLEGCGPLRIFDGQGRRRGRPRTPEEAAAVVDQVLGEVILQASPTNRVTVNQLPLPLELLLLGGPAGRAVLVPLDALEARGLAARLKQRGWTLTWARAALTPPGLVEAASAFGRPAVVAEAPEVLVRDGSDLSTPEQVQLLLHSMITKDVDRSSVLARVLALAQRAHWASLTGPLDESLAIDKPAS